MDRDSFGSHKKQSDKTSKMADRKSKGSYAPGFNPPEDEEENDDNRENGPPSEDLSLDSRLESCTPSLNTRLESHERAHAARRRFLNPDDLTTRYAKRSVDDATVAAANAKRVCGKFHIPAT